MEFLRVDFDVQRHSDGKNVGVLETNWIGSGQGIDGNGIPIGAVLRSIVPYGNLSDSMAESFADSISIPGFKLLPR